MKKLLLRIRAAFWFIRVDSWRMWKYLFKHGPRVQVFRNRRYPKGNQPWSGTRMYIRTRWGGQILGLTFGDRGGSHEYVRRQCGLEERGAS